MVSASSLRRTAKCTSALLLLILAILATTSWADEDPAVDQEGESGESPKEAEEEGEGEPGDAVLFPWFIVVIGVCLYYVLSRWLPIFPYTAACFLVGVIISVSTLHLQNINFLSISIEQFWLNIDGELLLLVFLPGLIYKDSSALNPHIFRVSFWQCFIYAFPMVLAGTGLTACVGFYLLPYNWSFDFAMMFGSILSATDPVAVAALLDSVGAPPRLKMLISGESLMNDGSAMVFYTIFSRRFLLELGIDGVGQQVGVREGFALFFRMSLGGVAVGIFFGLGLLLIQTCLNRRLTREENIIQVSASVGMAYLCYFTADVVWGTSGVIATMTMGLVQSTFGHAVNNDPKLAEDFASLVEHLLNTVLFTLGGLLWGSHVANIGFNRFEGIDWGYLIMVYVLAMVIRFVLFTVFYPLSVNIGLKTNVRETFFQAFGGLRGAVGIALSMSIDRTVSELTDPGDPADQKTHKLFAMVGGVAFLTLIINATTAGPILRMLGLADATKVRERIIESIHSHFRLDTIKNMVALMAQKRFHNVSFAIVRHHIDYLKDLTEDELLDAAKRFEAQNQHKLDYYPPYVENFLPYLKKSFDKNAKSSLVGSEGEAQEIALGSGSEKNEVVDALPEQSDAVESTYESTRSGTTEEILSEIRGIFVEILRSTYQKMITTGELAGREFLVYVLLQSLDFAADEVTRGEPLGDWAHTSLVHDPNRKLANKFACLGINKRMGYRMNIDKDNLRFEVARCLAFMCAHRRARAILVEEFVAEELSAEEKIVLQESQAECDKALALLKTFPKKDVEAIVSHKFCMILTNSLVGHVERLAETGMIKPTEAEEFLEDIQHRLRHIDHCELDDHPGELHLCMRDTGKDLFPEAEASALANASSMLAARASAGTNNNSVYNRESFADLSTMMEVTA